MSINSPAAAPSDGRSRLRAYLYGITVAATFLPGLVLCGPLADEHLVQGRVRLIVPSASPAPHLRDLEKAPGRLLTANELATLFEQAGAEPEPARERFTFAVAAAEESTGEVEAAIEFVDLDAERARAVLQLAASRIAANHEARLHAAAAKDWHAARDAVELAQERFVRAEIQLQAFLRNALLSEGHASYSSPGSMYRPVDFEANEGSIGRVRLAAAQVLTPEMRTAAEMQLNHLRSQREALLSTMTEAHPDVLEKSQRIDELQRMLADAPASHSPAVAEPASDAPLTLEVRERYREYSGHLESLRSQLGQLSETERVARLRLQGLQGQQHWQMDDVESLARPHPPRWRLMAALVGSLSLGAAFGAVWLHRVGDATFTSVEELAAALQTPVVGVVSNEHVTRTQWRRLAKQGVLAWRMAAEMLLTLGIAWLLVLAWRDGTFLNDLVRDPLGVISQGLARTAAILGSGG